MICNCDVDDFWMWMIRDKINIPQSKYQFRCDRDNF